MIRVIEPICRDLEHVPVNVAIIQIICLSLPDQMVIVEAERSHLENLKAAIPDSLLSRIHWRTIQIPDRIAGFWSRIPRELRLLVSHGGDQAKEMDLTLILSAQSSTIAVAKLLSAFSPSFRKVRLILHGGVSEIVGWRSANPLKRLTDLRTALEVFPRTVGFIVLEDAIRARLLTLIPSMKEVVSTLPHPLVETESWQQRDHLPKKPIKVGFIGLASKEKGFHVFCQIAKSVSCARPGDFEFHAIGSWPRSGDWTDTHFLETPPKPEKWRRDEFLARLRQLDFVCLPFSGSHYDLSASGTLMDAIGNCLPILGLRTPVLEDIFRDFSPGFIFDNANQMTQWFKAFSATQSELERYHHFVLELQRLRATRLPQRLAESHRHLFV